MAKSPFYKITLSDGTDVTNYITAFSYEDCTDEDDMIVLTCGNLPFSAIDKDLFAVGKKFDFIFGFIGGTKSKKGTGQICVEEYDYDEGVNGNQQTNTGLKCVATIKAKDLAQQTIKKTPVTKDYSGMSSDEIVKDIANQHKLKFDVDAFEKPQQGKKTNTNVIGMLQSDLLVGIAFQEGAKASDKKGNVKTYVKGDTIVFKREDLAKQSTRTYKYGDGNGVVVSAKITYEDDDKGGADAKVSTKGVDMETGEEFSSEIKKEDNQQENTQAKVAFNVDAFKKGQVGQQEAGKPKIVMQTLQSDPFVGIAFQMPANSKEDADKKITKANKAANSKKIKLTLITELDPTASADTIITMSGLAKKHSGNWLCKKLTHNIKGQDATSEWECYQTTSGGGTNKSQGKSDGGTTKKLPFFTGGSEWQADTGNIN